MIKINLLPVQKTSRNDALKIQGAVGALALIVTLGICWFFLSEINGEVEAAQQQITDTRNAINDLKKIVGEIEDIKKRKADLEKKLEVIHELEAGRLDTVRAMDGIARAVPEQLWLDNYELAGRGIKLSGLATDNQVIAEFMQNLSSNPQVAGVLLSETVRQTKEGYDIVRFSISLKFEPKVPATPKDKQG